MTFIDITTQEKRVQREQERRNATVEMAQNVIRNQMFTAQKIAGLLGETTAETKMTLTKLMNAMQDYTNGEIEDEEENPDGLRSSDEGVHVHPAPGTSIGQEEADGLPIAAPVGKPKLKVNTRYAKPAQDTLPKAASAEAEGQLKGSAY